jgi:hypothetical protein
MNQNKGKVLGSMARSLVEKNYTYRQYDLFGDTSKARII